MATAFRSAIVGFAAMGFVITSAAIAQDVGECLVSNSTVPPSNPAPDAGDLAAFTTRSGTWRVRASGLGYVWTLDENPDWSSEMACNESASPKTVQVEQQTLYIAPYACKFAQTSAPVQMRSAFIQGAINDGRWVPYSSDRADGWPTTFGVPAWQPGSLAHISDATYDPAGPNGTSASSNNVGTLTSQGGEYPTSRGAIDDPDAQIIAYAVAGQDISSYTDTFYGTAFSFAGYHYRLPFSGNVLRDPQKPISGTQIDYRNGGQEVNPLIESIDVQYGEPWRYDAAHLSNVGWALWLATEDPRIGMIVQSHANFALMSRHEYLRDTSGPNNGVSTYRCDDLEDRTIYNCMNSMWRARDVARKVRSNDVMLWSVARVEEMYEETTQHLASAFIDPVLNAPSGPTLNDAYRLSGAVMLNQTIIDAASKCTGQFPTSSGSNVQLLGKSNFMDQQYGSVPVYLRAYAGEALGKRMLSGLAKQMVARAYYIGGAAGIDGRRDVGGSGIPSGECTLQNGALVPAIQPFTDARGWAEWVEQQNIVTPEGYSPPRDAMDNANGHTAIQTEFILKAAQQLGNRGVIQPVEDVDAAIAAIDAAKARTTPNSLRFGIWYKHSANVMP